MISECRNAEQSYFAFFFKVARMKKILSHEARLGLTSMPPLTAAKKSVAGNPARAVIMGTNCPKRSFVCCSGSFSNQFSFLFFSQNMFKI
jgi:hypothetical protein